MSDRAEFGFNQTAGTFHRTVLHRAAFSLLELLIVIALLILVMALTTPALVNIAQGQGMKRAIGDVSGIVEQARSEAMATSTWTWVGLSQQNAGPQSELVVVLVASLDGTANMSQTNLRMISRPMRIQNVKVLPSLTHWGQDVDGTVPLAGSTFGFSQTIQGKLIAFDGTVLGFNSRGEASLGDGAVPVWIEIGLRELRGTTEIPDKTASIRVSGFSGQVDVDY